MTTRSSDLTIFIVPRGKLQAITAALRDWTAAGVAREHVVIGLESIGSGTASLVQRDQVRLVRLSALLTDLRPKVARVVLLSEQGLQNTTDVQNRITEFVDELRAGGGKCAWVLAQLMVTRSGLAAEPHTRDSWHTCVLSPEDSYGPGQAHDTLPATDGTGYAVYDSPRVAVLTGVLDGQTHAPMDDWPLLPNNQVRVVRTFVRRLDATDVEHQLRVRTHSLEEGFPRPRQQSETAAHHPQPHKACASMAESLWNLFAPVFEGPRRPGPRVQRAQIGVLESIRMFFAFMVAAIRRAPMAWFNRTLDRGRARVAGAVEKAVFGPDSHYMVTLGGVAADGSVPTAQEIRVALAHSSQSLGVGDTGQSMSDVRPLWKAYIEATLTLLDAEPRHPRLGALSHTGQPAVIRHARDIGPGATEVYEVSDGGLRARLDASTVGAEDVREVAALISALEGLQDDARSGGAASRELQDLREWQRAHAATFTAQLM
ncbi:MAG: hypothetical protein WBB15_15765, partial [Ornithinimicrobium sp.]